MIIVLRTKEDLCVKSFAYKEKLRVKASLDPEFEPAIIGIRNYLLDVLKSGNFEEVFISLERSGIDKSFYRTIVFSDNANKHDDNCFYMERLIKSLLWVKGGYKIQYFGPRKLGEFIKETFSNEGHRSFDSNFMSRIYEKPFVVEFVNKEDIEIIPEPSKPIGRNLDGCRIGFDAGGSDRKVSAVINGETIFSEEVIWFPKQTADPDYHYNEILTAMKTAASKMPRVDAIGVSSAGTYVNNRTMAASLFIKVPDDLFDEKVKDIYLNVAKELGDIPIEVANDGDVTALAGSMSLNKNKVLGIAMGTAQAAGYIDGNGNITGWLNELSFVPVDFNVYSIVDEWSGDYGVGCKYFSQDSVIKLAKNAGIEIDDNLSLAEKLVFVQEEVKNGNKKALEIFQNIGVYLGYALGFYDLFYDMENILILGRVTSGEGGIQILKYAKKVLKSEFPEIYKKIKITLPDEKSRRVGQSIAAASLPKIK
jgi:predicted NBD/HSP70 family sugar kinase